MNWLDDITSRKLPTLAKGSHKPGQGSACLMELISIMEGEDFSDHPQCVDSVLCSAGMHVNDGMDDSVRNSLLRLAPMFVGTNDPGMRLRSPVWVDEDDEIEPIKVRELICPFTGYRYHTASTEGLRMQVVVNLAKAWVDRYDLDYLWRGMGHERDYGHMMMRMPGVHEKALSHLHKMQRDFKHEWGSRKNHEMRDNRPPALREPDQHLFMTSVKVISITLEATIPNEQMHQMLAAEALGMLEAAIKVGPHTPEMRGWMDREHTKRAKNWAVEYA